MVEDTLHLALLGALLAAATASDVARRRVPNLVVALLAAAGFAAQWSRDGVVGALLGGFSGALVLAPLFVAWAAGKLGAGDVKLAAAAAIWLGPQRLLPFVVFAAVAGGPLAIATRLAHQLRLRRLLRQAGAAGTPIEALSPPAETVPFAVAIAVGVFAAMRWELP
jgi:prepilin peptidase CpaA